ncbi:MAG: PAS domain S-box protein [Verrucomicrobia bacterium]|nr:PAS domain S-box protein [Verrucomicrobiota bacterium]
MRKVNKPEHPAVPLLPPEIPPVPAVSEADLRRELGLVLRGELQRVLPVAALACLFVAGCVWVRQGSALSRPLFGGMLLTAGYAAITWMLLRREIIGPAWSHAIGGGLAALLLANGCLQFTADPSPQISLPLMLGLVAIGRLFLFLEWFLPLTLATLALWFGFAWTSHFSSLWPQYGVAMGAALVLAAWIYRNRSGTQRMLQTLRLEAAPQRAHLTKVAEEASRRDKQYRGLWDAGFDGLVLHDHGKILDANDSVSSLFGYERADLIGTDFSALLADASRAQFAATIQFGNCQSVEAVGVRKDGARIHLHLFNKPVPCGKDEVTILAVRDLTEQKQCEAVLQRERDRVEMVLRRQAALTRIDLAIDHPGDFDDFCRQVVEAASSLLRVSMGSCLILAENEANDYVIRASTIPDALPCGHAINEIRAESALGYVIENKEPLIAPTTDAAAFSLGNDVPLSGVGAYAAFPVIRQGVVTGVLLVLEGEARHYHPEELGFLEVLASRVGVLLCR